MRVFGILILLLNGLTLWSQSDSLLQSLDWQGPAREVYWELPKDSILLDSLSIWPGSVAISQESGLLADSCWYLRDQYLFLQQGCSVAGPLTIRFNCLPYRLHRPLFRKDRSLITEEMELGKDLVIGQGFNYNPYASDANQEDYKELEYSGSFARGLSLGNRQDLMLNSSFNLQVNGKVGDVEITGALSDNNIPLQPEGNTQQLQDFDRIYLQFKVGKSYLLAGDYDLRRAEGSYFLNYFRRLQGGQVGTEFQLSNKAVIHSDASVAISRGSFARNSFLGEEGNQGPYRLKGNKGETFIIILAGTERVFIDGILMERGADRDYVIDYNLGEIVFTNRQLITKDKRIQVEFSYSDLNYLRTIYTFNSAYHQKNHSFRIHWYSEQDAKNQPAQANLSDSAKAVLRRVGDNLDAAYIWGASIPEADEGIVGLVRYKLVDSLVASILYDSVLVYSTNLDSAIYTVRFTAIADGGNYVRVNDAVNGSIYQWVAPVDGVPQGTHEPIEVLATPKKVQMLDVGYDYRIGKQGLLQADFALSNHDQNTFSKVGNDDNQGISGRLSYQHKILLRKDSVMVDSTRFRKNKMHLLLNGHYEYVQERFEVIEPYRRREFQRDWNTDFNEKTAEHLFRATIGLEHTQLGKIDYELAGLLKDSLYRGIKHRLGTDLQWRGLRLSSQTSLLQAASSTELSQFLRPRGDLSYTFKDFHHLKIGVYTEIEQNRRQVLGQDSLLGTSIYYQVFRAYAELPLSDRLSLKGAAQRRNDLHPAGQDFSLLTQADELKFEGNWQTGKASKLMWNLHYRNLVIMDSNLTTLDPKATYLGRVEYNLAIRKGFIRLNTVYELGSGQQQKLAYNYLEVDKGQGTHIWIDRNEDGVQQQNEFEQAVFQDQANFIRVTLLTGEFVKSNNVGLSQSIDINPKVFFRKHQKGGWSWLGKFSSKSIFKLERKTLSGASVQAYNPFQLDVNDTALVAIGSNIRNVLYFNRISPKFRVEFQQLDARSRTLLNLGFDTRRRSDYRLLPSLRLGRKFRGQLEATYGALDNRSEFFPERDYALSFWELKPSLTYMLKTLFRAALSYQFKDSRNQINAMETALSHDISLELKYAPNKGPRTNIRASFSWIQLNFTGDWNTPVQFAMTDGLQDGQNFLWSLNVDRALSKSIQLSIGYEGRKTGNASVVHVGRAQIRALF